MEGETTLLQPKMESKEEMKVTDAAGEATAYCCFFSSELYRPTRSLYFDDMSTCGILMMTSKNVGHTKLDCFLHVESLKVFP